MVIHMIIFSRLLSYGGGRETWLSNFLDEIEGRAGINRINLYYFIDSESIVKDEIETEKFKQVKKFKIQLPSQSGKTMSLIRMFKFIFFQSIAINKSIKDSSDKEHCFLGIGSFIESITALTARLVCLSKNKKLITVAWIRGVLARESSSRHSALVLRLMEFTEKFMLNRFHFVISNGKDTQDIYESKGISSRLINNAIPLEPYENISPNNVRKDPFIVSYIGRLSAEKGFIHFIEAVKIFKKKYHGLPVTFHVLGDGPLESLLKENSSLFEYLGVMNNKKMTRYISTIDAGVALTLTSEKIGGSGVSNGLLELMGAGRLVICWENPIFTQVLSKESAYYAQEGNIDLLVEQIYRAAVSDDNFYIKGIRAKEISRSYSMKNHVDKFLELISDIHSK